MNDTILVTGGAGYIGSHFCKKISLAGKTPVVYDSLITGHESAVQWGPLEIGDVRDRDRLTEVIKQYNPDSIVHFSAFIAAGESVTSPIKYYRNNVDGLLGVLAACNENGVSNLIFSSTAAVYDQTSTAALREDSPKGPENPYGASKWMCETILNDCAKAYGLNVGILRYFNASGADPEGLTGECHDPETHLIPLLLAAAAGDSPGIKIFGTDYDTPDGTCIRDYIHVTDLAEAHLLTLEKLTERPPGTVLVYNLGTGHGYSVLEIVETVKQVTGKEFPIEIVGRRPGDPSQLVSDPSLALRELGWTATHSDVLSLISDSWNWYQKFHS